MKASRTILPVLAATLAAAGMVIGVIHRPSPGPEERIATEALQGTQVGGPRPQQAATREWRRVVFRQTASLGGGGGAPPVMPLHIRCDRAGCAYVLDWSDRCIRKYDPNGVYLMRFGEGEGRVPGRFINLSDFDIAQDGSVWACDPVNGIITVFNADGSVRTTERPERPPHRIAALPGDRYAVMSSPAGEQMFQLYRPGGLKIGACGVLMERQARLGIVLDGRIVATETGGFAYTAYRAGILAVASNTGDSVAVWRETLEHGGLPDVLLRRSGDTEYVRTDPKAPIITRSLSCVGGELHLLPGSSDSMPRAVMDVYDVRTGSYRYSYGLPVEAVAACVTRARLVAISDSDVTIWERIEGPAPP